MAATWATQPSALRGLWLFEFAAPVGWPLITTSLTGIGLAMMVQYDIHLPLPDPGRAKAMRGAWSVALLILGMAATAITAHAPDAGPPCAALARNTLAFWTMSVLMGQFGWPEFGWLPVVCYLGICMYLATDADGSMSLWAFPLNSFTSAAQWIIVGTTALATWTLHTLAPTYHPRGRVPNDIGANGL